MVVITRRTPSRLQTKTKQNKNFGIITLIDVDIDRLFQVGIIDEHRQLQEFFHKERLFQVINRRLKDVFLKQYHVFEVTFDYVLEFLGVW